MVYTQGPSAAAFLAKTYTGSIQQTHYYRTWLGAPHLAHVTAISMEDHLALQPLLAKWPFPVPASQVLRPDQPAFRGARFWRQVGTVPVVGLAWQVDASGKPSC